MYRRIVTASFVLGLMAMAVSGWLMWWRMQHAQLWGFLPLWFFAGLWLWLSAMWLWRWRGVAASRVAWQGAALSGLLLGLGWPPVPLAVLLFVAWVPLWEAESRIAASEVAARGRLVFGMSYLAFLLWNALTTYWVMNTAFVAGVFAVMVNALLMALVFTGWHHTRRLLPRLGVAPFIAYWMAFEWLHLNWQITWPWLNLGNGLARFPQWVQWYEWTGTFGGTLWLLLFNAWVWQGWRHWRQGQPFGKWRLLRLALVGVVPLALSWWRYEQLTGERGRPVEVVVVQPNFEPHYEKFAVSATAQLQRFLKLSRRALTDTTAYLVFPETSFGGLDRDQLAADPLIARLRRFIAAWPRLKLVTGIAAYRILPPHEPPSPFTRYAVRGGDTIRWEAYNAAIQLSNETDSIPFYAKSKLVPGAEFLPYREVLFFLEPIVDALQGSMAGHATQPRRAVFSSRDGRVGPVICYESVYGEYYADYVRAGAEALFIMTNDGWWDNTAGHRQHLMYASLRAIETRRPIARAANTGISAFIDVRGRIHQPTAYGEEAAIRRRLYFRSDGPTFYVRFGDYLGRLAVLLAALFAFNALSRKWRRRRSGVEWPKILTKQ